MIIGVSSETCIPYDLASAWTSVTSLGISLELLGESLLLKIARIFPNVPEKGAKRSSRTFLKIVLLLFLLKYTVTDIALFKKYYAVNNTYTCVSKNE